MNKKTILVLGGGGYVGCNLVRKLLKKNYQVIVYDLFLYKKDVFTDLLNNESLKLVNGDIRDLNKLETHLENTDIIIHLACISNDPSYELNPNLGKDINFDCFPKLINKIKKFNIKQFIYASSSSVYGVKEEDSVTEDLKAEPITDYSKFKLECEEILLNESAKFNKTIIRPATVCGYSERQRLDVIVNILTNHAYFNKKIIIHGGDQLRPNIHIDDMVDAYIFFLKSKKKLQGIYNLGFENKSILSIAKLIKSKIKSNINIYKNSNDPRSYRLSSSKILKVGFRPKKTVSDAIVELKNLFDEGVFKDNKKFHSLKWLKNEITK